MSKIFSIALLSILLICPRCMEASKDCFVESVQWHVQGKWQTDVKIWKMEVDYVTYDTLDLFLDFKSDLETIILKGENASDSSIVKYEWINDKEFRILNKFNSMDSIAYDPPLSAEIEYVDEDILVLSIESWQMEDDTLKIVKRN